MAKKKPTRPRKPRKQTRRDVSGTRVKLVEVAHWIGELRAKLEDLEDRVNGLEPHAPDEPEAPEVTDLGDEWRS